MRLLTLACLAAAPLALAACGAEPETDETAGLAAAETPMPVEPDGGIGDGAGPPLADGEVPTDSNASAMIPVALQGRWGMTENDCDPARSDNKGLLTISDRQLEFYESVGTLLSLRENQPTRIHGRFSFTGEGMNWTRDEVLEVQDGGDTLVRRVYGENASPEPIRYEKCA